MAQAAPTVKLYLAALAAFDWETLAGTLAPGVVRVGPYGDVVEGASAYAAFLARVVPGLPGYVLEVERVLPSGSQAVVRLAETITDPEGRRLRTEEALCFEVDEAGRISRVEVFLRKSEASGGGAA